MLLPTPPPRNPHGTHDDPMGPARSLPLQPQTLKWFCRRAALQRRVRPGTNRGPCCAPMIPSHALFAKCAKRMGGPGLGPDLVVTAICELDQIKVAEDLKLLTNFRTHIHIARM